VINFKTNILKYNSFYVFLRNGRLDREIPT